MVFHHFTSSEYSGFSKIAIFGYWQCYKEVVCSLLKNSSSMRPEEAVVLRVLRFVIVAALAASLIWMAYTG